MPGDRRFAAGLIRESLDQARSKRFQENEWGKRHVEAWRIAKYGAKRKGAAIVLMVEALAQYADTHYELYESSIGEDSVLGPNWLKIAYGVRYLLDGETGDLDCGTVSSLLWDIVLNEGFSEEDFN